MSKYYSRIFFVAAYFSVAQTSCKKFVEVGPPKSLLVTQSVFADAPTATAAMTSIYADMQTQGCSYDLALQTGLYTDELDINFSHPYFEAFHNNDLDALNNYSTIWMRAYKYIYQCNSVIEGCNGSATLDANIKKQLTAEAMFTRAFWYFYLVNLYGDVPLAIGTDQEVNLNLERAPVAAVYEQILTDLRASENNISDAYMGSNSVDVSLDRVRPNKSVVKALLSRVLLYTQQYAEAEDVASQIIADATSYQLTAVGDIFLKNNQESIWQLMMPSNSFNFATTDAQSFIMTSSFSFATTSATLRDAFDSSDRRLVSWIGKFTDDGSGIDYYYPFKYKTRQSTEPVEYITVFRLAEQYLIRSEARAKQNDLAGAIGDIDIIRARAGLPLLADISPGISQSQLIEEIFNQRRLELFSEWGHRWFDLKRRSDFENQIQNIVIAKGGNWQSFKSVWPIPQTDISNGVNIRQNEGYN